VRTIWVGLKQGDAKERLAIIADLVSVVGVSVASIIAALFAVGGKLDADTLFGVVVSGLLALAGSVVVLVLFLVGSFYLRVLLDGYPIISFLLRLALWLVFAAVLFGATIAAFEILSHTSFIRR
jgi:hypothetical protein